ncbi:MAG TPA: hypothetical protein VIG48_05460 [Jatrophihabitans sp.]
MGSIERRARAGKVRWYARYRDLAGIQHTRTFNRRVDAERYLTNVEAALLDGTYLDPARARISVGEWAQQWLDGQAQLKPSTRDRYAGLLRGHVLPTWGTVRLAAVSHADIQSWVGRLTRERSASTARKAHRVLSLVLSQAVRDGRIGRNPALGIALPRETPAQRRYLTHEQVHALAAAAGTDGVTILVLAYTGLRLGELTALLHRQSRPRRATVAGCAVGDQRERRVGVGHAERPCRKVAQPAAPGRRPTPFR